MKFGALILCVLLASGCARRRQQVALPPPPAATPSTAPRPVQRPPQEPAEPLSMPQTEVRLPQPQPISPEALATIRTPSASTYHVPEPESPKPARRVGPVAPPNVKPEPEAEAPVAVEAVPAPSEPRIQALVKPDERNKLAKEIAAKRAEIEKLLAQLGSNPGGDKAAGVERVSSFLTLANQAAERGDIRQADAITTRALLLARDLTEGR